MKPSLQEALQRLPKFCFSPVLIGLVILLAFNPVRTVSAQNAVLAGRVLDNVTNSPLPGVNVFIDQSLRGTSTDLQGRFKIEGLQPGSYTLAASMVGYTTETTLVELTPGQESYEIDFRLVQDTLALGEVVVQDKRPRSWRRNFRKFKRLFLGTSPNARNTHIINRYVLDFETRNNVFIAQASAPLQIENRALGYHITFVLKDFRMDSNQELLHMQGPFYFSELTPNSKKERNRWVSNRKETFRGSLQHLLASLVQGNSMIQGYQIQLDNRKDAPHSEEPASLRSIEGLSYFKETDQDFLYQISFPHYLHITYSGEQSWIKMNQREALLHTSGYIYTTREARGALTVFGALADRRVADLLPRELSPHDKSAAK